MKKKELLKAIAIILVPGGIPIWLGYKLYERTKRSTRNDKKKRNTVGTDVDVTPTKP